MHETVHSGWLFAVRTMGMGVLTHLNPIGLPLLLLLPPHGLLRECGFQSMVLGVDAFVDNRLEFGYLLKKCNAADSRHHQKPRHSPPRCLVEFGILEFSLPPEIERFFFYR